MENSKTIEMETREANAVKNTEAKKTASKTPKAKKSTKTSTSKKTSSKASKTSAAKKEVNKTINQLLAKSSGNRGQRTSIYNPSIYEGLTKKEQTSLRNRLRRNIQTVYSNIFNYSDKGIKKNRSVQSAKKFLTTNEGKQIKADFIDLYKHAYLHNDFSPASMYNGNDSEMIRIVQELSAALK